MRPAPGIGAKKNRARFDRARLSQSNRLYLQQQPEAQQSQFVQSHSGPHGQHPQQAAADLLAPDTVPAPSPAIPINDITTRMKRFM